MKNSFDIFCVFILALTYFNGFVQADISDEEFVSKYDSIISDIACKAMETHDGSSMKVNLSRYMTREELTKLTFWNLGNDFSKNSLVFENIKWKRDIVDALFGIFAKACPTEHVPIQYLNIFKELIMIYLNSVEPTTSNNTNAWSEINNNLKICLKDLDMVPYMLQARAMMVHSLTVVIIDEAETVPLLVPEESVDAFLPQIDLIIDNFWFMFSHAMGRCFNTMPNASLMAPKMKDLFVRDILRPLMNRWGDAGPHQNYGPIVGNFNINRVQNNIRHCVVAAYYTNGIPFLQLVRPLKVGHADEGITSVQNRKTGAALVG